MGKTRGYMKMGVLLSATFAFTRLFIDRPLFTLLGLIACIYTVASLTAKIFL